MKKTFALLLSILMILSVFPIIVSADDDSSVDHMTEKAQEWIEDNDYLDWLPASYIDISLTEEEKLIFDVKYDGQVLDITLKGKGNNEKAWTEAWKNTFLQSGGRTRVNYYAKYSQTLYGLGSYMLTYQGNGDGFVSVFSNTDIQSANSENHEEKGFNYFTSTDIFDFGFPFPVAQVSSESTSNEITIIPKNRTMYKYVAVLDDDNHLVQKIFVVNVHCADDIEVCETTEEYVPGNRISLDPIMRGEEEIDLDLDFTYDDDTGVLEIYYTNTSITDPNEILNEIHINNGPDNGSRVNIRVQAPDGYYYLYEDGDEHCSSGDVSFFYIKRGEFNKSVVSYTMTWYKESDDSKLIEKFLIKFKSPTLLGKTWMDEVASPTNEERLKYQYRNDEEEDWINISKEEIESETNIIYSYIGTKTGFIHVNFSDDGDVIPYKYRDISVQIIPSDDIKNDVRSYGLYPSSSDDWADPDEFIAMDARNYIEDNKIEIESENDYPRIGMNFFKSLEYGGSKIYYTSHSDGNQCNVIFWYDEEGKIIGTDYIYTYVDDYLKLEQSDVLSSESDLPNPVVIPVVVTKGKNSSGNGKNMIKIQYFPQEDDNGYYVKITGNNGWTTVEGDEYDIYFPYSYFGFENQEEALKSNTVLYIDHLTNANTLKEKLKCEYMPEGVKVTVKDFSPFYSYRVNIEEPEIEIIIDTVEIIISGSAAEEEQTEELNPETGSERIITAAVACAAIAMAGAFISRKER